MSDDDLYALIVLLSLVNMGPNRIRALTASNAPADALAHLRRRRLPPIGGDQPPRISADVAFSWFDDLARAERSVDLDAHRLHEYHVLDPSDERWPFVGDPYPPVLVFARGDLGLLALTSKVAIVGTRRCSSVGRQVASAMGADLGAAGVGVVSGLALGVDAAAHRGCLDAGGPAIGVVACGLDVIYPASNRGLWEQIGSNGLLLSEVPLGQRPTKWRFPARNRLIAALSDLVVVVESHERGGALSTVDEAMARGITVGAVPGSPLSSASDGTNSLLFDGAMPVRHGADVLSALGVTPHADAVPTASAGPAVDLASLTSDERRIVEAVQGGTVHLDRIIEILGLPAPQVGGLVSGLAARGVIEVKGHTVSAAAAP